MPMNKYFITGFYGFVGRHFLEHCANKINIRTYRFPFI